MEKLVEVLRVAAFPIGLVVIPLSLVVVAINMKVIFHKALNEKGIKKIALFLIVGLLGVVGLMSMIAWTIIKIYLVF